MDIKRSITFCDTKARNLSAQPLGHIYISLQYFNLLGGLSDRSNSSQWRILSLVYLFFLLSRHFLCKRYLKNGDSSHHEILQKVASWQWHDHIFVSLQLVMRDVIYAPFSEKRKFHITRKWKVNFEWNFLWWNFMSCSIKWIDRRACEHRSVSAYTRVKVSFCRKWPNFKFTTRFRTF